MTNLSAYAPLSERVAALTDEDDLTITPADFPDTLEDHTPFGGLVIDTGFARHMGWAGGPEKPFEVMDRSLGFEGFAEAEGFRRLGLWMLHAVFSGRDWAGLTLTHPTSRVQAFYVDIQRPMLRTHNLTLAEPPRYASYEYSPQEVWRHPFASADMAPVHRVDEEDRPFFAFGWSSPDANDLWNVAKADQIILEATPDGLAAMACVLMDMAHPVLGREEISFEPPIVGFAATQPRSLEARFWRPGSLAFYCDTLDELVLPPMR